MTSRRSPGLPSSQPDSGVDKLFQRVAIPPSPREPGSPITAGRRAGTFAPGSAPVSAGPRRRSSNIDPPSPGSSEGEASLRRGSSFHRDPSERSDPPESTSGVVRHTSLPETDVLATLGVPDARPNGGVAPYGRRSSPSPTHTPLTSDAISATRAAAARVLAGRAGGTLPRAQGGRHDESPARVAGGAVRFLTEDAIKAATNEMEVETVMKLVFTGKGLSHISGLVRCRCLTELNLSDNHIERIEGLEGLIHLKKLVLTNNKIRLVEGLEDNKALEHLLMQANDVTDLAGIQHLSGLQNLVSVYFKNVDGSQRNPVCTHPEYRSYMLSVLPQLRNLDGERLRLTAQAVTGDTSLAFDMGEDADPFVQREAAAAAAAVGPPQRWLEGWDWGTPSSTQPDLSSALAGLKALIQDCRGLSRQSDQMLTKAREGMRA
eukprot:jgi/Mesvir1/20081/Mv13330-RA.1